MSNFLELIEKSGFAAIIMVFLIEKFRQFTQPESLNLTIKANYY
jgi:hypothetical protein